MAVENKKNNRSFTGVVVGTKMDKTVTVLIERTVKHKKYLKQYTVSKRFKAHDEKNEYKVGDKVLMEECRPMSKDKRWRIIKKLG